MKNGSQPPTRTPTDNPKPKATMPTSDAAAEKATPDRPAPGLDTAKHAAAQRHAHQAKVLRERVFPFFMVEALSLSTTIDAPACKIYLEQLLEDAGNPSDPIVIMMVVQLGLTHLRIALLHKDAAQAKTIEAVKIYNSVAARMQGEFRRSALALRVYRGKTPESADDSKLQLFKAAQ